jgi:hypothetical protein
MEAIGVNGIKQAIAKGSDGRRSVIIYAKSVSSNKSYEALNV